MLSRCVEKVKGANAEALRAKARSAEKAADVVLIDTPPGIPETAYQAALVAVYPKVHLPGVVMKGYREPAVSPKDCIFAQTTSCVSADLSTRVTPCQFGGRPVCSECGYMVPGGAALNVVK